MTKLHHSQASFFAKLNVTPETLDGGMLSVTVNDQRYDAATPKELVAKVAKALEAANPKPRAPRAKKVAKTKGNKIKAIKGNVIKAEFRERYAANNGCGDQVQLAMSAEFIDGDTLDRAALRSWAQGLGVWPDRYDSLNNGMVRMNVANRVRALVRKGQKVKIGKVALQRPAE